MLYAAVGIVSLLVGILVGYILRKNSAEKTIGSAETQAKNIILDAENRSEALRKETVADARHEAHQIKAEAERDIKERREELKRQENRLIQKENAIDRKTEQIERKDEAASMYEIIEDTL